MKGSAFRQIFTDKKTPEFTCNNSTGEKNNLIVFLHLVVTYTLAL